MNQPRPPMPSALAEVFRPLQRELVNIHIKWRLFRQLFGTDQGRIELLNRFAGGLFGVVQEVMYDDLVLALFRIADPRKTGRHENLSLDQLADTAGQFDTGLGARLQASSAAVDAHLAPHSDWRDKLVAHNDLATAQARILGAAVTGPSRRTIEGALADAREALNLVQAHYGEGEMRYEDVILAPGDGDALVRHLGLLPGP